MMEWFILASNIITWGLHVTIGLFLIYRLLPVEKPGRKALTIGLIGTFVRTEDETVDYLINSKVAMAASNQIQLQVQIEFPRHTNIKSADLYAILGNLLDNALEAVEKIPEPKQRVIHLIIRRINQMLVIKVENYFADIPRKENGNLKTTKTEYGLHGWGLKSAQTAAEKYDGMLRTTYEGNTFRVVATLSYHGVSTK